MRDVFCFVWEEGAAAGGVGELLQRFVAAQDQTAVIGRNGVDNYVRTLRHFDGLHPAEFALVVLAVTDHDNGMAHGMVSPPLAQLVAASAVDGVVERSAS